LELSPHKLRLAALAYGDFPAYLQRLPGLVSDSLPDGWGLPRKELLFSSDQDAAVGAGALLRPEL